MQTLKTERTSLCTCMKRTFVSLWQVVTKATKVSSTVKHLNDQGSGKTRNISMRFVFFHFLRL